MTALFRKLFARANLLDLDGNLSLTNTAVLAFLCKILAERSLSWRVFACLVAVLLNYAHKRIVVASMGQSHQLDLKSVEEKVERLQKAHTDILKIAEEAKKLASTTNLGMGFVRRSARE